MLVRPCRPRAKRPKDFWATRAELGRARGLEICREAVIPRWPLVSPPDSAVLGLQTGWLVLRVFLLLPLPFLTPSPDLKGQAAVPPRQAVYAEPSAVTFVQMFAIVGTHLFLSRLCKTGCLCFT